MAYKSVGTFHPDVLHDCGHDIDDIFGRVTDSAKDMTVFEVGEEGPELWHDDYEDGWIEAGEFESIECAMDAQSGFNDESEAVAVYDYNEKTAKLMVKY